MKPKRHYGLLPGALPLLQCDVSKVSLKRVAWAYGTAKKGSNEEQLLLDTLLKKVQSLLKPEGDYAGGNAYPSDGGAKDSSRQG